VEFCYNSAEHEAIEMSPFQVVYRRQPLTLLALMKEIEKRNVPAVKEMLKEWRVIKERYGEWVKQAGLGDQVDSSKEINKKEQ
jgi:hypothetical protein